MEGERQKGLSESRDDDRRLPVCMFANEWAEHARFYREDEPCDDGRAGHVCGRREGEEACPI